MADKTSRLDDVERDVESRMKRLELVGVVNGRSGRAEIHKQADLYLVSSRGKEIARTRDFADARAKAQKHVATNEQSQDNSMSSLSDRVEAKMRLASEKSISYNGYTIKVMMVENGSYMATVSLNDFLGYSESEVIAKAKKKVDELVKEEE